MVRVPDGARPRWRRLAVAVGRFWWDFLVGEAPELLLGGGVAVVGADLVVHSTGVRAVAVAVLPVLVVAVLALSAYRARARARAVDRPDLGHGEVGDLSTGARGPAAPGGGGVGTRGPSPRADARTGGGEV